MLAAVDGLELSTVVSSRAEQVRADLPGVRVLPGPDALWERADVDVVVLATPNRTHVPLGLAAVAAGLPVVVDKPLARTADEARTLVDAAAAAGVLLTTYQNRRYDADVRTARRCLADGSLGEPLRLETRFERWRPQPKGGWRESADPDEGGGLLLDLGSHSVDAAVHLLGPAVRVYAEADVRRPGAQVEDDVMLALTHSGGARSTHWLSATAAHLGPRLRLLGRRGALVVEHLDVQEDALRAGRLPGPGWGVAPPALLGAGDDLAPVPTEPGDYRLFYVALRDALRDGAPPPVPPQETLHVLAVLDAARASARSGQTVAV